MANSLSSAMNIIAARMNALSDNLRPHAAYLSAVHINPTPEQPISPNDTVKVNVIDVEGSVVDALTAAPSVQDVNLTATELRCNKLATKVFKISNHELLRLADSPMVLDKAFEYVALEIVEKVNSDLSALFTTTTFDTSGNTTRTATPTAGAEITADELGTLRTVLSSRKIPINARGDLFIIAPPTIYGKWLNDDDFAKASSVGDEWASALRSNGSLQPIWNFLPLEDPQSPVAGTTPDFTYQTAMFHRNAAIVVNGQLNQPPDGTAASFTSMFGLPMRITAQHQMNIGATGGSYTAFMVECCYGVYAHRKNHCAIHTTVLDTP